MSNTPFPTKILHGTQYFVRLVKDKLDEFSTYLEERIKSKADKSEVPKVNLNVGKIKVQQMTYIGTHNTSTLITNVTDRAKCGSVNIGSFVIKFGYIDTSNQSGNARFTSNRSFDVPFNESFPNACMTVVATTARIGTGRDPQVIPVILGWDKDKFRIMGDHTDSNVVRSCGFSYIAIGY